MTILNQIYKCEVCGNIINILHIGAGELVCCGQAMLIQFEKTEEADKALVDKHLPVIKKLPENVCRGGDGIIVKIGKVKHPMDEEHYIEWIEVLTIDNKIGRKFLKPGETAKVEFHTRSDIKEVRAYCNMHGLWKLVL